MRTCRPAPSKPLPLPLPLALLLPLLPLAACTENAGHGAPRPALVVVGSTSMRPVVDALVDLLRRRRPELHVSVDGGGSARGICAVATGDADIGMTSRPPKEYERRVFPSLVYHPVAVDGISVVVHGKNPVRRLSKDQLRAIYLGQITDWQALGGSGPIVPVAATTTHGTFDGFADFLRLDGKEGADHATVELRARATKERGVAVRAVNGTAELLAAVVADPGAIACVSTTATNAQAAHGVPIATLALDGVEPTEANLLSGRYAFQRSLSLVTRGEPGGIAKLFVDFAVGSQGQLTVRSLDAIPAAAPQPLAPPR
jgi:phosphate transport system substrate-binding protein